MKGKEKERDRDWDREKIYRHKDRKRKIEDLENVLSQRMNTKIRPEWKRLAWPNALSYNLQWNSTTLKM